MKDNKKFLAQGTQNFPRAPSALFSLWLKKEDYNDPFKKGTTSPNH